MIFLHIFAWILDILLHIYARGDAYFCMDP